MYLGSYHTQIIVIGIKLTMKKMEKKADFLGNELRRPGFALTIMKERHAMA